jgi:hypothetical protein
MVQSRMPGILGRMFSRGGLAAGGVVEGDGSGQPLPPFDPDQARLAPDIPANWRELKWPARRSLAAAHSDEKIVTAADAERAILAALAER